LSKKKLVEDPKKACIAFDPDGTEDLREWKCEKTTEGPVHHKYREFEIQTKRSG